MEKQDVLNAIKLLREKSPKKNFVQSIDILINFKDLDLKKPEHKVDSYIQLPHPTGKKIKLCALIDEQLNKQAQTLFDKVILKTDFDKWKKDVKGQKKLANEYDFFVAQAEIMIPLAVAFGKVLGARGKMPNPKAGCVVPGTANLEPITQRLKNIIRLQTKNELSVKTQIGNEKMDNDKLAENILAVYNNIIPRLPQEKNNLKYVALKLTMGPLIKISGGSKSKSEKEKKHA